MNMQSMEECLRANARRESDREIMLMFHQFKEQLGRRFKSSCHMSEIISISGTKRIGQGSILMMEEIFQDLEQDAKGIAWALAEERAVSKALSIMRGEKQYDSAPAA